jgi:hypothetical protein
MQRRTILQCRRIFHAGLRRHPQGTRTSKAASQWKVCERGVAGSARVAKFTRQGGGTSLCDIGWFWFVAKSGKVIGIVKKRLGNPGSSLYNELSRVWQSAKGDIVLIAIVCKLYFMSGGLFHLFCVFCAILINRESTIG